MKIAPFAKAVYGAVVGALLAFLGALTSALVDPGTTLESVTAGQWLTAIAAALAALPVVGGTVYQVTNRPVATNDPEEDEFVEVEL